MAMQANNTSRLIPSRVKAIACALTLGLATVTTANASSTTEHETWGKEKTSIVAGTSVAGALIGGPIGFIVGLAAGDWLGNNVNKADKLDNMVAERDLALAELSRVQEQLAIAMNQTEQYQALALDTLQLSIMFGTAEDQVNDRAIPQLDALARLLMEQPELKVQLSGFADPRGAEAFNLELSERRASSVQQYLVSKGISEQRIKSFGYGARMPKGERDLDAFAMERIVTIELQSENQGLAISQ
ncbi:OmpA family protein [Parendozoicomonas haliclonae]|uniref:Peptidoglycan-associated lipoprotein n=1 Tax=Parendozoicomonas haliclonae TaxID=1960125 RepID=A0A1X7AQ59_9GAMM|nr:OmpA family protein [Parendozoicomonas haliclonae]SMA50240.1 Peptidoglycan-associated lipoprotein precursor [Parendozoicomonas haliclonae]